jgi:hydrogenase maturation protein HypF
MGRLFDAVASLCVVAQRVSYEGESGLLLEASASKRDGGWKMEDGRWEGLGEFFRIEGERIDWEPLVRGMLSGKRKSPAWEFHRALAELVVELAGRYPELPALLSGGVFQNRTLMELLLERMPAERLLLPSKLPPNDGAVSLGQLWFALNR